MRWLLLYLWSAPLGLLLIWATGWDYDGGLGWWAAMAWALPYVVATEPLREPGPGALVAGYYGVLAMITLAMWLATRQDRELS